MVISSGLLSVPCMVIVKAMMGVAMVEVGFVLLSLERGDIMGERERDGRSPDG